MTDRRNNSNDVSEDDWAMSEPEPELKGKELEISSPPEEVNENVSNLYDPLETDELKGWDISEEDTADLPETAELPDTADLPDTAELSSEPTPEFSEPAPAEAPPEIDQTPRSFQPSPNSIEIIKPEKPVDSGDNWEMKAAPPQDGWKMPEPEFRHSEGKPLQQNAEETPAQTVVAASPQEQQEVETLSEIYAPPDTEESSAEISESAEPEFLEDESDFSEEIDEIFESDSFDDQTEEQIELEETPPQQKETAPPKKNKGRILIFVLLGLLGISVLLLVILGAAYLYYSGVPGGSLDF